MIFIPICASMIILIQILFLILLPSFLSWASGTLTKKPEEPTVSYGEFPYTLKYNKNDELIEVKDTLVVEYLGSEWDEGNGNHNMWNIYHKNSELIGEFVGIFDEEYVEGIGSVSIVFYLGSSEYYMGLDETMNMYANSGIKPGDIFINSPQGMRTITEEELYEQYGIEIIEKSISSPLNNTK